MTSTKKASARQSYAQNLFRAVQKSRCGVVSRHPTYGFDKCLIHNDNLNCLFTRQFKQALDLQGLPGFYHKLSTKLSTGTLDNFEALKIHARSGRAGADHQALRPWESAR
ncbi:MAG: hypothetical protein M3R45_11075 [Pseudomonadota bacterium]|nr:hypothetical protein [Pseudomonadota bacterium]